MIVGSYYMMYDNENKSLAVYTGKDYGILFFQGKEVLKNPDRYKNISVKGIFVDIPGTRGELDFILQEITETGEFFPYGN